jgi:gamma-glutamylcyclotransferase (GGCT)/AIG2-like uncharacterized protein YtfP
VGRLVRHRFVIMREGYASLVRDPRRSVWGTVWELALADMPALDRYEGVAGGLYVKVQQPVVTGAGPRRALVYVGRNAGPGQPRPGYLEGRTRGCTGRQPAGSLSARDRRLAAGGVKAAHRTSPT